jgi:hypothetical protein
MVARSVLQPSRRSTCPPIDRPARQGRRRVALGDRRLLVGDRGHDVHGEHVAVVDRARALAGRLDDQRRPQDVGEVVLGDAPHRRVRLERVAVVGGDHHQRVVERAGGPQLVHHPAEQAVRGLHLQHVTLPPHAGTGLARVVL